MLDYTYNSSGTADLMGIHFDYPGDQVVSKHWLGAGSHRVWQSRVHDTQCDVRENDYNDSIPGETFACPEFKGHFDSASWTNIRTREGIASLTSEAPDIYIEAH